MYINVQFHLLCMLNIRTILQNTTYERHLQQTMKSGLHMCMKCTGNKVFRMNFK